MPYSIGDVVNGIWLHQDTTEYTGRETRRSDDYGNVSVSQIYELEGKNRPMVVLFSLSDKRYLVVKATGQRRPSRLNLGQCLSRKDTYFLIEHPHTIYGNLIKRLWGWNDPLIKGKLQPQLLLKLLRRLRDENCINEQMFKELTSSIAKQALSVNGAESLTPKI